MTGTHQTHQLIPVDSFFSFSSEEVALFLVSYLDCNRESNIAANEEHFSLLLALVSRHETGRED